MIIRVENSRVNLIKMHDIFKQMGYSCKSGSLDSMYNELESVETIDDMFKISDKYLGDTNQVKYIDCSYIKKTYSVHDVLPDKPNSVRVNFETLITALRVKRSREEYASTLISFLGGLNVPDYIEEYARNPTVMKYWYYIKDSRLCTCRLFDWEAEYIIKKNLWGTELKPLTAAVIEYYQKIDDKRNLDYNVIPS